MACCPPPETRIVAYLLTSLAMLLWLINPRLGAVATAAALLLLWKGTWLLGRVDAAMMGLEVLWRRRRGSRAAGSLYCPDCGLVLQPLARAGLTPHYDCPECAGAWCGTEELSAVERLRRVHWKEDQPAQTAKPLVCPKCARPMEQGGWAGTPITAHRCPACGGTWVPRMSWVWLQLETRPG